jgi:hypothetical protein
LNDPHIEPPPSIVRNPITIAGAILTTISALLFIAFMILDLSGLEPNHYVGLAFVVTIPPLFVAGLLIIPLGMWRERRRLHKGLPPSLRWWPRIDLNSPRVRFLVFAFVVLTPINILIISVAGYQTVESTESVAFCGATCHTVMQPEYTAYQAGPHARVKCVQCHVGDGAGWFIKAKLAGTRQLVALATGTYSRPVPAPVHNLRPATSTCEHCHWPAKFHGDKVETIYDYADDEKNTETVTTLRLKIGGRDGAGHPKGIHWHVAEENRIEYVALDEKRQNIAWVRQTTPDGGVVEYRAGGVTDAELAKGNETRVMDCVDCHNRPSHIFARSVERGVNGVISGGAAPKDLPFLKREAVNALKIQYASRDEANAKIEQALTEFYKKQYPDTWTKRQKDIESAIAGMKALYNRNIFPEMKLTWGFHPDNRGHMEFPGCFRCHDDNHKSKDGKVIRQDCDLCHEVL